MQTIVVPVVLRTQEKPIGSILFENGLGEWKMDPCRGQLVWSNIHSIQDFCTKHGAEIVRNSTTLLCSLTSTADKLVQFRQGIERLPSPHRHTIPVQNNAIPMIGGAQINYEFAKQLKKLGTAFNTYISITRCDSVTSTVSIIGLRDNVEYTKFKLQALLEYYAGSLLQRIDLPLSLHNLVFGPCKMHLLNIFQQTAVNVFIPPYLSAGRVKGANWDQIYLVGEAVQVAVAKVMLDEVIDKTEVLVKSCAISQSTLDILYRDFQPDIYAISSKNATFIEWPQQANSTTLRVLGTNVKSIQSTINSLMKLCTQVYTMVVGVANASRADLLNLAECGTTVLASEAEIVLNGTTTQTHKATNTISQMQNASSILYTLELDNQLKDFLAGKKNGKILKVMNSSNSKIWFEPLHEYNFRVMMLCTPPSIARGALLMLEEEMPAEEEIFIAEPYHKQIIGAGGQRIQALMRRYNVYIKFEAISDKIPNAAAHLQLNNVLVRCPKKHSKNIGPAIQDLRNNVALCEKEHSTTYLRLSRNHRRLLIGGQSNLIRDIEKWSNAVIKYPHIESRNTEMLEVSGLGQASISAAKLLQESLPYDYEFRVAYNRGFAAAVGPNSTFALRVTAPLRAAFKAQVQAFEQVQFEDDSTTYSQIMVSIPEEDDFIIGEIDSVVTSYLRDYQLDIIEKGPLSMNLIVDGSAKLNKPQSRNAPDSENMTPIKQQPVTFNFTRTPMTPTPRVNHMGPAPTMNWRPR